MISYRPTFCRNGRRKADGTGLLQIECRQQRRTAYFSARVAIEPSQWQRGQIVNHPIARDLNLRLRQMMWDLMAVEMDCVRRGVPCTLETLREAWREQSRPTARLTDFGREFINSSQSKRGKTTRRGFQTLFNSIDKFRPGCLVQDVDYQFVSKYEAWLRARGNGHNTRVGRLRLLRTVVLEAKRRKILQESPFDRYKIPGMTSKKGFLTTEQLRAVEQVALVGKEARVRDLFLLSCYTGLRFSDISTLRDEHVRDGWLVKRMVKTGHDVRVPLTELFGGRAAALLASYGGATRLCQRTGANATVNRLLKDVLLKAGIPAEHVGGQGGFTFHTARHTFASLLLAQGVGLGTIQRLLGHTSVTTTQIYAEVTQDVIAADLRRAVTSGGEAVTVAEKGGK